MWEEMIYWGELYEEQRAKSQFNIYKVIKLAGEVRLEKKNFIEVENSNPLKDRK